MLEDYCMAPAAIHPSGRNAWQNGCPAVWCYNRTYLLRNDVNI
jgi:hypothetical protein